jgi:hypothetical protein
METMMAGTEKGRETRQSPYSLGKLIEWKRVQRDNQRQAEGKKYSLLVREIN